MLLLIYSGVYRLETNSNSIMEYINTMFVKSRNSNSNYSALIQQLGFGLRHNGKRNQSKEIKRKEQLLRKAVSGRAAYDDITWRISTQLTSDARANESVNLHVPQPMKLLILEGG